MNDLNLKKHLGLALLSFGLLVAPGAVFAQATTSAPVDECSRELLLAYFPEPFVTPTLKKFNVPQDKWSAISQGLAARDKDVLKIVEEKASKLNPNPFKDRDPAQRQVAVKIFRETLTQVFSEVLKANGVTDDDQITKMLDDIQQQKAKNFAQCMEKQKQNLQQGQSGQAPAQPSANDSPKGQSGQAPAQPSANDSPKWLSDASTPAPNGSMKPVNPSSGTKNASTHDSDDHDSDDDSDDEDEDDKDDSDDKKA